MTIRSAAPHATALLALAASAGLALAQAADGSESARVLFPGDTLSDGSLITSVGAAQANNAGALGVEVRTPAAPAAASYAVLDGTRSGIVLTPGVTQIDGVTVTQFYPGEYGGPPPSGWPWLSSTNEMLGAARLGPSDAAAVAAGLDGHRTLQMYGSQPPPFPQGFIVRSANVAVAPDGPTLVWSGVVYPSLTPSLAPTEYGHYYVVERDGERTTFVVPLDSIHPGTQLLSCVVAACTHTGPIVLFGETWGTIRATGLFVDDGASLAGIAFSGNDAPGFPTGSRLYISPNLADQPGGSPLIAPDHSIAWTARVGGPSGQDIAFYRTRDTTTTLIASAKDMLDALGQPSGSPAALSDYRYLHQLTRTGGTLLRAYPYIDPFSTPRNISPSAIWLDTVTPNAVLVAPNQPAIGFPGQQVRFVFGILDADELGLFAYTATIKEPTASTSTTDGLWTVAGPGGQHALWLRRGQAFEVAPGDRRTVDTIVPLHLTPDGLLTVRLGFDDATAGLFRLQLTAGPCNAADINADRSVNFGDVARFLRDYTEQAPAADINADANIDAGDVAAFLAAFSAGC